MRRDPKPLALPKQPPSADRRDQVAARSGARSAASAPLQSDRDETKAEKAA